MNTALIIGVVIAFVLIFALKGKAGQSGSGISNIDATTLKALRDAGKVQYIDVRTPGEFAQHSAKGFKNIPLQSLSARMKELNPELPIIVVCASGARSMQASQMLSQAGFKSVYNVKGGLTQWMG